MHADDCTSRQERVSFARILVETNVTMKIPKKVLIEDGSGKVFK